MSRDSIRPSESSPEYPSTFTRDAHRVILCRHGIQWIIQRTKIVKGETQWRSISFCVTRKALERNWKVTTETPLPTEITESLPPMAHHHQHPREEAMRGPSETPQKAGHGAMNLFSGPTLPTGADRLCTSLK